METFRKINLNAAETMANFKIIPVAVLNSVDQGLRIAELLTKYGISAIEITFRTQVAAQAIAAVNAASAAQWTPEQDSPSPPDSIRKSSPWQE